MMRKHINDLLLFSLLFVLPICIFPAYSSPASFLDRTLTEHSHERKEVRFRSHHRPGTIVVDTKQRHLYFVLSSRRAVRYGIGVAREGHEWSGTLRVARKETWPSWTPTKRMIDKFPEYGRHARGMAGGIDNPLGARALYLFRGRVDSLYRFH
jgi:lipoprotein-anchoring transpeptidase ErfK/SrfK